MKLALFGATGQTGNLVLQQALARGDSVTALARSAARERVQHERLVWMQGSPTSPDDVSAAIAGADAVIHCLGIGGKGLGRQSTVVSDSVKAVLGAMQARQVKRLVCMSNVGAGGSGTWFANHLVIPIFLRWLVPIIEDKNRMETLLEHSQVEWVSVRLPNIIDGPAKPVRVSADGKRLSLSITAASTAAFLLEQTLSTQFLRQTPSISN
jgi:putative NADH-flavin reductase